MWIDFQLRLFIRRLNSPFFVLIDHDIYVISLSNFWFIQMAEDADGGSSRFT